MGAKKNEVVTELPKELVALRAAIREAVKLNDADTLEDRIEAAENVAIGAILGKDKVATALSTIPAQDSGEALIGHWCFLWDSELTSNCGVYKVSKVDSSSRCPYTGEDEYGDESCGYIHARPIKLGLN